MYYSEHANAKSLYSQSIVQEYLQYLCCYLFTETHFFIIV